jgi:ribosomal protein S18 acetylase RimI-like enzyme
MKITKIIFIGTLLSTPSLWNIEHMCKEQSALPIPESNTMLAHDKDQQNQNDYGTPVIVPYNASRDDNDMRSVWSPYKDLVALPAAKPTREIRVLRQLEIDTTVGYISYEIHKKEKCALGYIHALAVASDYQKKSCEYFLLTHALGDLNRCTTVVELKVKQCNSHAIVFYRTLGLKPTGVDKDKLMHMRLDFAETPLYRLTKIPR